MAEIGQKWELTTFYIGLLSQFVRAKQTTKEKGMKVHTPSRFTLAPSSPASSCIFLVPQPPPYVTTSLTFRWDHAQVARDAAAAATTKLSAPRRTHFVYKNR